MGPILFQFYFIVNPEKFQAILSHKIIFNLYLNKKITVDKENIKDVWKVKMLIFHMH